MSTRPEPSEQLVFDDPLSQESSDTARLWGKDDEDGWGERPAADGGGASDLARFLDEKPPHHL
ncbi:hypothetical protein DVA86_23775 [Streptomyces armeniacus]|uniref:Uncharacterized protein n=1 Tax=Streptomyces armeniacus TaxID=83291 RepID=A0A345Y133_9ACTN|nr:hypothetical protein [Streptomyces armeniacus]AXK37599.1 hypothetical protein DVA86_23775 [Streptomyces armeniacus]